MNGPLLPLTIGLARCVAARETGLSLRVLNLVVAELTQCGQNGLSLYVVERMLSQHHFDQEKICLEPRWPVSS